MNTSDLLDKTLKKEYPTFKLRTLSVAEHNEAIDVMAAHLDDQDNGKVGIFWFDRRDRVLFGVVAIDKDSFEKPNVGGGLISCRELHSKVWSKEFHKQKYKKNGIGPFVDDYKDTPRGRVFYNTNTNKYEIKVGDWIDKHPEAIDEVVFDFDLQNEEYEVIKDYHWDIGSGWENF